jgi:ABC-type Fe3+ transport system permease subunit
MGSVLYAFPVAFLMFHDSLQYEDYTIYEAADVVGISKWRQFWTITVPSMRRTIVSAVLAVFTMIFTDYGVPLMTGGTAMTLPVYMYREVIGMMNFSGGAVAGVVLLLPAVVAYNETVAGEKYARLAGTAGLGGSARTMAVRNLQTGLKRLRSALQLPATLAEAGVDLRQLRREWESILTAALADPCCAGNPRRPDGQSLGRLLEAVTGGA